MQGTKECIFCVHLYKMQQAKPVLDGAFLCGRVWLEGNTEEGFEGVDNCFLGQGLVTCEEVIKLCVDVHFSLSILKFHYKS